MSELPDDVATVLRADPAMADLLDRHGAVTVDPSTDPFHRFAVSIVNQSISTAAAKSIRSDLYDRFGRPIRPATILEADTDSLAEILGSQKAEYVRNAAERFLDGDYSPEVMADVSDDEVIDELTTIRGVGRWTAEMYLIFGLGREDVFPVGDLAVRRGTEALYGEMTRAEMVEKARDWEPYRSYATKYIWAEYESD